MKARRIEDQLDELRVGYRHPVVFRLRNGRQAKGIYAGRDERTVRLTQPANEIPIKDIEAILIEVTSEGPE